jgi:phosphoserine phosphatase RsbX
MTRVLSSNGALEWGTAAAPIPGEQALGDRAVVAFAGDRVLAAVIDGLGHGPAAAAAAQAAAAVLERSAAQDPVATVQDCHRALRDTRGAALSLASIDVAEQTMTWLGVGNVEGRLWRGAAATESLPVHGGIVGHELPRLSARTTPIGRGDVLIFATDGIQRDFADHLVPSGSCPEIAQRILDGHALGSDDALVLVARYLAASA